MKRVILVFLLAITATYTHAQYSDDNAEKFGTLKFSGGYTNDFPGLGGYSLIGEYSHTLCNRLEGSFGVKRIMLSGYPRTESVNEYTKATTIDFGMYFLPLESGNHVIRAGISYSFTFVQVRRSFPLVVNNGTDKTTEWPVVDDKQRLHGFNYIGEYEYRFPELPVSLGLRVASYKAYDRVKYIGPFVAVRL